jgi:hypothetical protein
MKLPLVLEAIEWMLKRAEDSLLRVVNARRFGELSAQSFKLKMVRGLIQEEGDLEPHRRYLAILAMWYVGPIPKDIAQLIDLQSELALLGLEHMFLSCNGVFDPEPVTGKDFSV